MSGDLSVGTARLTSKCVALVYVRV